MVLVIFSDINVNCVMEPENARYAMVQANVPTVMELVKSNVKHAWAKASRSRRQAISWT
jgi:hypothetical protein